MIFHRLKLINKSQKGFTLIELIIAIAITGLITGGITMTIFQVFNINALSNNHMKAVRQVQNAGYWISHDAQMTQQEPVIVKNDDDQLESITLTWEEWDSKDEHQVVYSLLEDNKLQREHYTNRQPDSLPDATTIVAEYIDPDPIKTNCEFTAGVLVFTVTATVGNWPQEESETRVYEVIPRPGS